MVSAPKHVHFLGICGTAMGAVAAALRERGADVDPEVGRFGGPVPPMFWFRDLDGNQLLVVGSDD